MVFLLWCFAVQFTRKYDLSWSLFIIDKNLWIKQKLFGPPSVTSNVEIFGITLLMWHHCQMIIYSLIILISLSNIQMESNIECYLENASQVRQHQFIFSVIKFLQCWTTGILFVECQISVVLSVGNFLTDWSLPPALSSSGKLVVSNHRRPLAFLREKRTNAVWCCRH